MTIDFKKNKKSISGRKLSGVSLIEVLIVVAIIAILSSVVLINLKRSLTKAEYAEAQMQMRTLANLVAALEMDTGKSPLGLVLPETDCVLDPHVRFDSCGTGLLGTDTDEECLAGTVFGTYYDNPTETFENWGGPYTDSIPLDPWGTNYFIDFDYFCNDLLKQKGCEGYYDKVVRAIVSFGPNKTEEYNNGLGGATLDNLTSSDDVVYVLCTGPWP